MESNLMWQVVSYMLPCPDDLQLETMTIDTQDKRVTLAVTTRQASPVCPCCHTQSYRVHSRYRRVLADLPWAAASVCLQLQVRKCFCSNPACRQRIFCERLPDVAAPWARRTQRLAAQQRSIGLALGGAPSERLSEDLDRPASRDTFLRLVRTTPTPETPTPRCLGVDDWSLRKGQRYGSIIIDLERSVVLDVLPDRTAQTFAHWLQEHPGVEIISRDRGGTFAEGAALGAPDAVQVADRWHLLKNLGDALTNLFDQHRSALEKHLRLQDNLHDASQHRADPVAASEPDAATIPTGSTERVEGPTPVRPSASRLSRLSKRKQDEQARRRDERRARYEEVRQLRTQGWTLNAIAEQVRLNRNTVRKYVQAATFPERQPRSSRSSLLDPFKPYILARWGAEDSPGCHTGAVLLREVEERGYRGGSTIFLDYITQLRQAAGLPPKKRQGVRAKSISDPTQRLPSSRALTWLVLRKPDTRDESVQERLARLRDVHADIATALTLAEEFAIMVRQRQSERLDGWLARTEQSKVATLVSFAKGIRRDYAAVKAGLTLVYSNGATEGHVNRLKMLKRQMFGRAKLDLLKTRLIAA